MSELFLLDASSRPAHLLATPTCALDEASAVFFSLVRGSASSASLVLNDETLGLHWGENQGRHRTLVIEQLPLEIALGFTHGVTSYFDHLFFVLLDFDDYGRVVRAKTVRFGEREGEPDVLRQASVVMADVEATSFYEAR